MKGFQRGSRLLGYHLPNPTNADNVAMDTTRVAYTCAAVDLVRSNKGNYRNATHQHAYLKQGERQTEGGREKRERDR